MEIKVPEETLHLAKYLKRAVDLRNKQHLINSELRELIKDLNKDPLTADSFEAGATPNDIYNTLTTQIGWDLAPIVGGFEE